MAVIKLNIYVADIDDVIGLFDKIRVWVSTTGLSGPYVLMTTAAAMSARIDGTVAAPFTIHGDTFTVAVNGGSDQTMTFVVADPVQVDAAVEDINDQTLLITASANGSKVRLDTDLLGRAATLEIVGGTSLTELGFVADTFVTGSDAHVSLVPAQSEYEYEDVNGDSTYYYKTQYYNSSSGTYSGLSDPVKGDVGAIVPAAELITAVIDIVDLAGVPVENNEVAFYNVYIPPLSRGAFSVLGRTVSVYTNGAGHAEISLIRGATVDVTITNTGITRRIEVPETGDEFNLMDAVSAAPDNFQIQTPSIPLAVRRS